MTTPDSSLPAGARHYRSWVGPPDKFDLVAGSQFTLLVHLGLREDHSLLDVGCGSLRGGRLFIPYLLPERYFGIEPEAWTIEEGIRNEVGQDQIDLKRPSFSHVDDFRLTVFGRKFDFILAQSIFSHAARHQVERCLSQAAETLEPDGVLVATYFPGAQDYPGTDWVYPGAVKYRVDTIRGIVQAVGLAFAELDWPHPNGQTWFVASRPARGQAPGSPEEVVRYAGLLNDLKECRDTLARIGRTPAYRAYRGVRRLFRRSR